MTTVALRGSRWVVDGTRDLTPEGKELEKLVEGTVKLEPLNWWAVTDNESKAVAEVLDQLDVCVTLWRLVISGDEHETRMSVENHCMATRMKGPPISLMTIEDLYDLVHHVTSGYQIEIMIVLGAVKDWVENQPGDVGKAAVLGPGTRVDKIDMETGFWLSKCDDDSMAGFEVMTVSDTFGIIQPYNLRYGFIPSHLSHVPVFGFDTLDVKGHFFTINCWSGLCLDTVSDTVVVCDNSEVTEYGWSGTRKKASLAHMGHANLAAARIAELVSE